MEKLAENNPTYVYLRHVVIVITAVTTISLPPVMTSLSDTEVVICIILVILKIADAWFCWYLVFNATVNNISVISY
jgi:hypothetical protein